MRASGPHAEIQRTLYPNNVDIVHSEHKQNKFCQSDNKTEMNIFKTNKPPLSGSLSHTCQKPVSPVNISGFYIRAECTSRQQTQPTSHAHACALTHQTHTPRSKSTSVICRKKVERVEIQLEEVEFE